MRRNVPLIASVFLHILVVISSYFSIGSRSKAIKDSGFTVYDFVQVGPKSKAPVLSDTPGKASKTKARADEKQTVSQKSQPKESSKTNEKKRTTPKKNDPAKSVPLKGKKPNPKPKSNPKKPSVSQKASEKAVVNLRKNKQKTNADPKAAKKSLNSLLDSAIADGDNENYGAKAEDYGDVLTANDVDLIRQTIRKCWHFPAGLKNAEELVVDIKMELDKEGNVTKAEIVNKENLSNPDFKIAAENAHRAVLDPACNPLPLPKDKYDQWKNLELSFNPEEMF